MTQSSRLAPALAIQAPMTSSVRPTVSTVTGFTGYISAVSMKLIPASAARSIWAWASSWGVWVPHVIVPRHQSVTFRPLRPRSSIFMRYRPFLRRGGP